MVLIANGFGILAKFGMRGRFMVVLGLRHHLLFMTNEFERDYLSVYNPQNKLYGYRTCSMAIKQALRP